MSDVRTVDALHVLDRAARRGLPVLDRYDTKWVREGRVWRNVRDGRKRTSYVLTKFTPLQVSTLREAETEPLRVGGVNVPGQLLTRDYVDDHQERNLKALREPRLSTCSACDCLHTGPVHRGCQYREKAA